MTPYEYRCAGCGAFSAPYPMGTAPSSRRCPACAAPSPRSFAAPATRRHAGRLAAAVEAAEASAQRPEVVRRAAPAADRQGRSVSPSGPRRPALPRP